MPENDVVVAEVQTILTHVKIPLDTYIRFARYLEVKYTGNESEINKYEVDDLAQIIEAGLVAAESDIGQDVPILHDGRKPRQDVLWNLARIATEFLKCYGYPKISSSAINPILNRCVGDKDQRTIKKYRKTILLYCNVSENTIDSQSNRLGILDVSGFVGRIPKKYLLEKDLT